MSRFISFLRFAALIIAASLLTACSVFKFAYNQAPDLSYRWLDGYFDFDEQQTMQLRADLNQFFAWHRKHELLPTAELLAQAAQLVLGEMTAAQACAMFAQGMTLAGRAIEQSLPALARLAPSVRPEQIEHLKRKYAKNKDEFNRDFVQGSAASRDAKRLARYVDRAEMLYGKLDEMQLAAIKQVLAQSGLQVQMLANERQRRHSDLIAVLLDVSESKAGQALAEQALRAYFQRIGESPDPRYRAYAKRMKEEACQDFASVHASTTLAQRRHAAKTLKGYEADLRVLAGASHLAR